MSFAVDVDVQNPGQFFACCGLLELASRLDESATCWFDFGKFHVEAKCTLSAVVDALTSAQLEQVDRDDDTSSPIRLGTPFHLLVDWWKDDRAGGRDLKVWAGTMQSGRIERAMIAALHDPRFHSSTILDEGIVVRDPSDPTKKVEPFYFDARRSPNAHSRDIGFAPNDLGLTTVAFPAVEALCLVGLQRFRPRATAQKRIFDYWTWRHPLSCDVASAVTTGLVPSPGARAYRFENWYRTGQKKHKAFRPARPLAEGE